MPCECTDSAPATSEAHWEMMVDGKASLFGASRITSLYISCILGLSGSKRSMSTSLLLLCNYIFSLIIFKYIFLISIFNSIFVEEAARFSVFGLYLSCTIARKAFVQWPDQRCSRKASMNVPRSWSRRPNSTAARVMTTTTSVYRVG